jgi:hypothetical protein
MLKYNLGNKLGKKNFISFYKLGDWSIFVEMNVMHLSKTQISSKNNLNDF